MIKLEKIEIPPSLEKNAGKWLSALRDAVRSGDTKKIAACKSKYNHPDVKAAVIRETSGKCAFCESEVRAVSHGDIEHCYPKSLDENKTFEWENLGYACQICNQNKSDADPLIERIIDPYRTDPEPFIAFFGAFINSMGTTEGRQTIHHLKLDRAELFERRQNVFKNLIKCHELLQSAKTESERAILVSDFERNELGKKLEYSALRRDFWKAYKPRQGNTLG